MKIFFIVDETKFMLPEWFDQTVKSLKKENEVVGVTPLVTKSKLTWQNYLLKNMSSMGIDSILKLGIYFLWATLRRATIFQTAVRNNLTIISTEDVNDEAYLQKIAKLKPDLIISSCSQIFGGKLLSLPKVTCLNRHSSLLPSYGGVLPIFWAILNKEKTLGVTIHKMTKEIDRGQIVYQKSFRVGQDDTLFSLYRKAYKASVEATCRAVKMIKEKKRPVILSGIPESYYRFPKPSDWETFFKMGYKFI